MKKQFILHGQSINRDSLIKELREHFLTVPDHRAANVVHRLDDVLMSAYAMFALKYPSLLCFEQQTRRERQNLRQVFGLQTSCSDAQMRRILDEIEPATIQQLFPNQFEHLQKAGLLHNFKFLDKYLLLSIDGVEYFRSKKIKCPKCQTQQHNNGEISYSHSMLAAVLVHPYRKEVFPISSEAIQKQDGQSKNDCELNAAKRLQQKLAQEYENQPFIIVEDALYANEPHINAILDKEWQYIISIKPGNNERFFRYFENRKELGKVHTRIIPDGKGAHHFYWINGMALNNDSKLKVNFLYYEEHKPNGKVQKFSWITSLKLSNSKVYQIMKAGRARWKIENETFNTLKNQGYHFEHNYGHGYKNLCNILALLMLLAFFIDQLILASNKLFQNIWKAAKSKKRLWESLRAIFMTQQLDSFNDIKKQLAYMYEIQLE